MGLKTPMMLITGSLGSGKTTLLKRVLEGAGRRLAVLMNELGEAAIDSKVIQGKHVEIVELAGGCACCTVTGEFQAAVREILERIRPEAIIVETTGVAETDVLAFELEANLPEVRLDGVVFVADSFIRVRHAHIGRTTRSQLVSANVVLINKVDLVTNEEVREVEAQIRKINDTAVLFKTVGCDVDVGLLFGLDIKDRSLPVSLRGDPGFQSFSYSTDVPLDPRAFRRAVSDLPLQVYRAKGFASFAGGGGCLFNYVTGRVDIEEYEAEGTLLSFIGRSLDEVRNSILDRLRACEVLDAL
jgi:G3E family GTPase